MTYRQEVGKRGETLACAYLEEKGFQVIGRNIHVGHDEIDIIAEDEKYIIFAEVKTRAQTASNRRYGTPAEAVNFTKKQKLLRSATEYLREHPVKKQPRIDVVEVYFPAVRESDAIPPEQLDALRIRHFTNAVHK